MFALCGIKILHNLQSEMKEVVRLSKEKRNGFKLSVGKPSERSTLKVQAYMG
jgi:hypothetical protein